MYSWLKTRNSGELYITRLYVCVCVCVCLFGGGLFLLAFVSMKKSLKMSKRCGENSCNLGAANKFRRCDDDGLFDFEQRCNTETLHTFLKVVAW